MFSLGELNFPIHKIRSCWIHVRQVDCKLFLQAEAQKCCSGYSTIETAGFSVANLLGLILLYPVARKHGMESASTQHVCMFVPCPGATAPAHGTGIEGLEALEAMRSSLWQQLCTTLPSAQRHVN